MRRPPIRHKGRAAIPAHAAIEFLQVSPAFGARRDEVPLVPRLRLQTAKVLAVGVAAEGAPHPRRRPAAATHVAGEPAPAVLDDIAEARWRSAERTDAELPHAVRQVVADRDEVRLEERPQRGRADESHQHAIEPDALIDGPQLPTRRKQRRDGQASSVPGFGERAEAVERVATKATHDVEDRSQQGLDGLRFESWRRFGQEGDATLPTLRALACIPVERRDRDGSRRPQPDELVVDGQCRSERRTPAEEIAPGVGEIDGRHDAHAGWSWAKTQGAGFPGPS